jgi:hypothetical protein
MPKAKQPRITDNSELRKSIRKKKKSIDFSEIGTTGDYFSSGRDNYEYQSELLDEKKYVEFDKMRRGSAMAKATIQSVILPLMSASWFIRPGGRKRADKAQSDFVTNVLFKSLRQPWTKILYNIGQQFVYGTMPFEKVYIRSKKSLKWRWGGDYVILDHLSPRNPATIEKWLFNDNGSLKGIEQQGYFNNSLGSFYKTVTIPSDKLVFFTNEQEGDNYSGVSLLRPGYGSWRSIKTFYNIANVGIERMCIGYPCFEYPPDYWNLSPPDREECSDLFDTVIKNFRAHHRMGCKIPPGAKLHIVKGEFDGEALERFISHHETKIAQAALASFLKTGEAKVGSHALFGGQTDFFLKSLIAAGEDICYVFNNDIIPELINLNFKQVDNYPELYVKDIGSRDLKEFAEMINTLIKCFVLTPDEEGSFEDEIRKMYDLPDRTEEQKKRVEQKIKEGKSVFVAHPGNQNSYTAEAIAQQNMKNNPDGSASMPVDEYGNNQSNNQSNNQGGNNFYPKPVSPSGYTKPGLTTHPLAYANISKSLNSGSGAGIYNNE